MDEVALTVPQVSGLDLVFLGLGLYWGEGTKNRRGRIAFSNSDPRAIRAYLAFLQEAGADTQKLRASLFVHTSANVAELRDFWSKVTGIEGERIYITRTNSSENSVKRAHGILNITLQDMVLSRTIFGWLEGLFEQFSSIDDECEL
jgi:hypothetical protein